MREKIKITSITYVKNGIDYIEQCVRSVMNQTLREIEIIVVDGGSSDGTVDVIKKLCDEDCRIMLLTHAGSVGGQFNMALKVASGEYIAVCEGDDYILPDKYEKQYQIAKEYDIDVLRAAYYQTFFCKGNEYRYKVKTGPSQNLYDCLIEVDDNELFLALGINGFWSGIYKKEFLVSHNIYMNETRGAAYQDVSFSFFCQLYAKRIWFMSEAYHCYRIDNPSASVNSNNCIDMHMEEYRLLKERLINNCLWNRYQYMFMVWEIGSYRHFIDELPIDGKLEKVSQIYDELVEQEVPNCFDEVRMPEETKKIISVLQTGKESFCELMLDSDSSNIKTLEYFTNKGVTDTDVILFGAGHLGNIVYDFLKASGKSILVVDNSRDVQRKGFRGQKVFAAERYVFFNDYPVIIANVAFSKEIYYQLKELGVSESRIIICNNEEIFLRKIFVGLGDRYGIR